jgi:hypothetical protein
MSEKEMSNSEIVCSQKRTFGPESKRRSPGKIPFIQRFTRVRGGTPIG